MQSNAPNLFSGAQSESVDQISTATPERLQDFKAAKPDSCRSSNLLSEHANSEDVPSIAGEIACYDYRYCHSGLDRQGEDNPDFEPPLKTREELDSLLADAGVRRTAHIDDVPGLANVTSPIDGKFFYLCRYQGADLCGLLPPAFDDKPVWCAWLDASFKEHLLAFINQRSFRQYGNRTSDPWIHDQFFELSAAENDEQYESAAGIAFSATALWHDWQKIADDGYVTFVFQCAGQLTVTAYAVNEKTLESLGSRHRDSIWSASSEDLRGHPEGDCGNP